MLNCLNHANGQHFNPLHPDCKTGFFIFGKFSARRDRMLISGGVARPCQQYLCGICLSFSTYISGICAEKLEHGTPSSMSMVQAHSAVFLTTCLLIPPIFLSFSARLALFVPLSWSCLAGRFIFQFLRPNHDFHVNFHILFYTKNNRDNTLKLK